MDQLEAIILQLMVVAIIRGIVIVVLNRETHKVHHRPQQRINPRSTHVLDAMGKDA